MAFVTTLTQLRNERTYMESGSKVTLMRQISDRKRVTIGSARRSNIQRCFQVSQPRTASTFFVAASSVSNNVANRSLLNIPNIDVFEDDPTSDVPIHTVTIINRQTGNTHTLKVPQNRYILHSSEKQDAELPNSCRNGCCTTCAVRVISGQIYQPSAMGISQELKQQGYALLCVGYPLSDLVVETQDEDEVYEKQFGQYFAKGQVVDGGFLLDDHE
mmetsp:Transcript_11452/g.19974  ORF Transcript_11452/g.19974 Transcript_11452/m.19974 type:complete len:216 (-) Transcript_11452:300-947(-)|eukprot:CAMPEP_0196656728 /NCGR_PEP_ID=MMETSP1086-20130531/19404_1 /TAXON_ID=77921 /ORGANISM="Cyanoptyche  gloeocystis , Strain SAG4.97" /LENGTH=215 /DNA_ID=CAMNT_0041989581 /DNA_START=37 /DNA_END=684 /DNA_ORIENTATION=-